MFNKQFVAESMMFKSIGAEASEDESIVVKVVEVEKSQIEIAFTLKKTRHYLKFNIDELQNAVKMYVAERKKR